MDCVTRDSRDEGLSSAREARRDGYVRALVVLALGLVGAKGEASVKRESWRSLRV